MTSINEPNNASSNFQFMGKIIHHHFNGSVKIFKSNDDKQQDYILFNINKNIILFHISKIEVINSTDKKLYISKVEYSTNFPQDIVNLFQTLGLLAVPTVFYLKYEPGYNSWFIKNNNFTTVFLINES